MPPWAVAVSEGEGQPRAPVCGAKEHIPMGYGTRLEWGILLGWTKTSRLTRI
jgi:hypothetical protein